MGCVCSVNNPQKVHRFLYGVKPTDPLTFAGVATILGRRGRPRLLQPHGRAEVRITLKEPVASYPTSYQSDD